MTDKSVFISYRRSVGALLARLIYRELEHWNYDVFLDVESLGSGKFPQMLEREIEKRQYFVLILTPGTLEGCADPNDWLRREIEYALGLSHTIIPLMYEGFQFKSYVQFLSGKLSELPDFNGITIVHEYFDDSIRRLRKFLGESSEELSHYESITEVQARRQHVIQTKDISTETGLSAEQAYVMGIAYQILGNSDAALASLTRAIEIKPDFSNAYNLRGLEYIVKKDLDLAMADFTRAIDLDPDIAAYYDNLGTTLQFKGHLKQAIEYFDKAIKLDRKSAATYYNRGNALSLSNDQEGAIKSYTVAITLDPTYCEALTNRGSTYEDQGRVELAFADFNSALDVNPNFFPALNNRGLLYQKTQKYTDAKNDFTRILKFDPCNSVAHNNLTKLLNDVGETRALIKAASDYLHCNPDDAMTYLLRGEQFAKLGKAFKAIRDLERFLHLSNQLTGDVMELRSHIKERILYLKRSK